MRNEARILVIGTADTKADELMYLQSCIGADASTNNRPPQFDGTLASMFPFGAKDAKLHIADWAVWIETH